MHYSNLHQKQEKTKGFVRAVMPEWEPNSGKHQCGADEGISAAGWKPEVACCQRHYTYNTSALLIAGGMVYREDSRSDIDPAQICKSFKHSFTGEHSGPAFGLLLCKMHLAKHRPATQGDRPLSLERSGCEIPLLFI